MEDGLDAPVCILKMNLQCCEDCPLRIKKCLQKIKGVYAITIDPPEGLVLVCGAVEPSILAKAIEETGKRAEIYAYEKDPKRARLKFRCLLRQYAKSLKKGGKKDDSSSSDEEDNDNGGGGGGGDYSSRWENVNADARTFGMPPPIPMMHMPTPPFLPPGWYMGPRPSHHPQIKYEQPAVQARTQAAPYPYSFYEEKELPIGSHSLFSYFSDQNAEPCAIM